MAGSAPGVASARVALAGYIAALARAPAPVVAFVVLFSGPTLCLRRGARCCCYVTKVGVR